MYNFLLFLSGPWNGKSWVLEELQNDGDVWVETFCNVAKYIRATHHTEDGWIWIKFYFNKIYYYLPYSNDVSIYIYDICGREIKKSKEIKKTGSHFIDISYLPNGIYFINLSIGKEKKQYKIIKIF